VPPGPDDREGQDVVAGGAERPPRRRRRAARSTTARASARPARRSPLRRAASRDAADPRRSAARRGRQDPLAGRRGDVRQTPQRPETVATDTPARRATSSIVALTRRAPPRPVVARDPVGIHVDTRADLRPGAPDRNLFSASARWQRRRPALRSALRVHAGARGWQRSPTAPSPGAMVAGRGRLRGLRAVVRRQRRRRHRRPARDPRAAALPRRPRRRHRLAHPVLPVAAGRPRLRRRRLPRRRPDLRHARRPRRADRRRPRARAAGRDRPRAQPHLRPAPVVRRRPLVARRRAPRLLRLARPGPGRRAAQQLGQPLRRPGLDLRRADRPVLHAPVPARAARPELGQPRGPRRVRRHPRDLVRAGVDGFRIDVAHSLVEDPEFRTTRCSSSPAPTPPRRRCSTLRPRPRPRPGRRARHLPRLEPVAAAHDAVLLGEVYLLDPDRLGPLRRGRRAAPAFCFPALQPAGTPTRSATPCASSRRGQRRRARLAAVEPRRPARRDALRRRRARRRAGAAPTSPSCAACPACRSSTRATSSASTTASWTPTRRRTRSRSATPARRAATGPHPDAVGAGPGFGFTTGTPWLPFGPTAPTTTPPPRSAATPARTSSARASCWPAALVLPEVAGSPTRQCGDDALLPRPPSSRRGACCCPRTPPRSSRPAPTQRGSARRTDRGRRRGPDRPRPA
jgi:hypothetical protein